MVLLFSCAPIGPPTIARDRFDYTTAIADSWKRQMLLNIVKIRYGDAPIFLDVASIINQYSLETELRGTLGWSEPPSFQRQELGGTGRYYDRPTITYTPLTGEKFLQGFLNPINPAKVFALVQSGYAADFILELSVDSMNGLRNRPVTLGSRQTPDPEFFRVLMLMREIQDAGAVGLRIQQPTNGQPATILFFRSEKIEPVIQRKIVEVRELLGLTPGESEFRLVQSPMRGGTGELGITTRSLSQVMAGLSMGVEVPPSHQKRKLTPTIPETTPGEQPLLRIHSGPKEPVGAFAAVSYEGEWFWIANDDWKSKRTFSSILFLFTLADTGASQNLPTITIPAQ